MMYGDAYNEIRITVPISDLECIGLNQRPIAPRSQNWDLNPARFNTCALSQQATLMVTAVC